MVTLFNRKPVNSQSALPEYNLTSIESRVQRAEELLGWARAGKESISMAVIIELILERNVIPEFNKQYQEIERILALAVYTTIRMWPPKNRTETPEVYVDEDMLTAAQVAAKTAPFFGVTLPKARKNRIQSVLNVLTRDQFHASYLRRLSGPIMRQILFPDPTNKGISDERKFGMLSKAIGRTYVWKEDVE